MNTFVNVSFYQPSLCDDPYQESPEMEISTSDQSLLEPVVRDYASTLQLGITLNFPSGHFSKPQWEGGIHLHVFSLPIRPNWFGLIPRVPLIKMPFAFGHRLWEGTQMAFAPSGKGKALHDQEGRPVAEIIGTNVYILFNLIRQGEDLAPVLLRRVLDLAFEAMVEDLGRLIPYSPERLRLILDHFHRKTEAEDLKTKLEHRHQARTRHQKECDGRLEEEIRFLEEEIKSVHETIEEHSRFLTTETRRLMDYRRRLRALKGVQEEGGFSDEFDYLVEIPEVREVQVQDGIVSVFTNPIHVEYGKKQYDLGSFRVDIQFNGQVSLRNLTKPYGLYDHPHVWDGRPCLGNTRAGLAKLIGEFQLVAATQVLIDFLKTINHKDWYISIENWGEEAR